MIGCPKPIKKPRRQRHKQSVIQKKDGRCFLCMMEGDYQIKPVIHEHHIFGGSRRRISEAEGLKVYLCPEHHTIGKTAVHNNYKTMFTLQQEGQKAYELTHNRSQWMTLMHKNYIE